MPSGAVLIANSLERRSSRPTSPARRKYFFRPCGRRFSARRGVAPKPHYYKNRYGSPFQFSGMRSRFHHLHTTCHTALSGTRFFRPKLRCTALRAGRVRFVRLAPAASIRQLEETASCRFLPPLDRGMFPAHLLSCSIGAYTLPELEPPLRQAPCPQGSNKFGIALGLRYLCAVFRFSRLHSSRDRTRVS